MSLPIVTATEMSRLESLAYAAGIKEEFFMEKAGRAVAQATLQFVADHKLHKTAVLLCGKGNNAGDAYVAGQYLLQAGFKVIAYQFAALQDCSPLCKINQLKFAEQGGSINLVLAKQTLRFPPHSVCLDGLFGTGFHGKLEGAFAHAVAAVKRAAVPVIAIDIPSGIDGSSGEFTEPAIEAALTLYLSLPKLGFFVGDAWNHVGQLQRVDFGLPEQYSAQAQTDWEMITQADIANKLPKIKRNRHKYEAGYVVGIAGSATMPGAAMLSSLAVLRSGAGVMRLLHPDGMQAELSASPYELIRQSYTPDSFLNLLSAALLKARAAFIGPGLGVTSQSMHVVKQALASFKVPCVIDADALNILAEHADISLPQQCVLTPHHGEMLRLLGQPTDKLPLLELCARCAQYVARHNVTLVLKGSPTLIFQKGYRTAVIPHGDPGMATAGCGDVLTGMIAAFLAQGLSPRNAALVGTYLHAIAGEHAAAVKTSRDMIASDVITYLPQALKPYTTLTQSGDEVDTF